MVGPHVTTVRRVGDAAKQKAKRGTRTSARQKARTRADAAADRVVKIRALDPQAKCGPGTSVQQLYRVDERTNGKAVATHLVFFDRHGWYCEHGRSCPAVADVRKSQRR